ncbi:MAG TPA: hypothetical protein VJT14_01325 [Candidatus Dormibacteraeota bacterium]|nr:hypothetical protein [Candidatus Dormibacteraeota bacterium]
MGLFSARRRLAQPSGLTPAVGAVIQNTGREVAARLGKARLAAIAGTNDPRVVAILLVAAAVALGLEMAASFHVI